MHSPRRIAGTILALGVAFISPRQAHANMAAPTRNPAGMAAPLQAASTPLIVRHETLTIQCDEIDDAPVCAFEARYRVENPSGEVSGGRAAFYGLYSDKIDIKVDGRPAGAALTPEDERALDESVKAAAGSALSGSLTPEWSGSFVRSGFLISVPPGGRSEIVVTGRMMPGQTSYPRGYTWTPAEGRHLLLHRGEIDPRRFEFYYLVSPIKTWAEVHRMDVSVRYPRSWSVGGGFRGTPDRSETQWTTREDGGFVTMSTSTFGKANKQAIGNVLELSMSLPGGAVEHGGPYVGIGGVAGSSDASGFRMRFGYEIAAPSWLVESLTVDTDFSRRLVIAPNIEAALPHLLILPSLGIGVGVPVQVIPTATVGARVFGTLQVYPFGFVTSVDIFPGLPSEEGSTQVSLMARVSL